MSVPVPYEVECKAMVELVTDYLEGVLSEEERTLFEMHVCLCDGCNVYLEQMRQLKGATGRLSEETLTPEARDELLAVFRAWKHDKGGGA